MSTWLQRGRGWISRRIERRIAAYSVAAILVISLLFGALSLAATLWIIRHHQRIDQENRLDRIVARLNDKADVFVRNVQSLSKNPLVLSALLDSKGRDTYLLPFFTHYRIPLAEPHSLALCDFEGKRLAQQDLYPMGCLAERPQSRAVIDAEQRQAIIVVIEQKPYLTLFQPVFYPSTGRAEGYILAALDLHALVTEKNLTEPNAILMLHSLGGTLDFATGPYPESPGKPPARPLFAAGPFAAAGLTLAHHESSTLFAGFEYLLLGYGLGTLALVALALALSHQLARRLAEPLLDLNRAARRIAAQGPTAGVVIIDRADEIGGLAVSFNDMVAALRRAQDNLEAQVQARTEELQRALIQVAQSDEFTRAILDSMDSHIAVLDHDGEIVTANESWRRFALANGIEPGESAQHTDVGVNYLEVCQKAIGEWSEEATVARDGIRAVLAGWRPSFTLEYPCHSPHEQRWFLMRVTPFNAGERGAVITHTHITERKQAEEKLRIYSEYQRAVLDNFPFLVWLKDRESRLLAANVAYAHACGFDSSDALIGLSDRDVWPADLADAYQADDREVLASDRTKHVEELIEHVSQPRRWFETYKSPVRLEGRVIGTVGFARDITDRKRRADELEQLVVRLQRAETTIEKCQTSIFWHDAAGKVLRVNDHACRSLGYSRDELIGLCPWDFDPDFHPEDWAPFWAALKEQGSYRLESRHRRKDGTLFSIEVTANYVLLGDMELDFVFVNDITDRKRMQEALREQAIRDPLTGLFNRRYLDETLPRELSRCQRSGEPLAVAMLDLDHFKQFNDAYGHEAGDVVLRAVGDLLGHSLRAGDLPCRYGGEELTLILHGSTLEDARLRLDTLRRGIRQLHLLYRESELPAITVSIGVAEAGSEETDATALLGRADAALYQAKARGRNRVVVDGE